MRPESEQLLTLGTSRQAKSGEGPDGPKNVARNDRCDFSTLHIGTQQLQSGSAGYNDFLVSGSGKVTRDSMGDCGG